MTNTCSTKERRCVCRRFVAGSNAQVRPRGALTEGTAQSRGDESRCQVCERPEVRCVGATSGTSSRGRGRAGRGSARRRDDRLRNVVLSLLAAAFLVVLALPWGGAGGHSLVLPGSSQAGAEALKAHSTYVVQPGDTLWSIASRLDPDGDPRPLVARLSSQLHGETLVPGEALYLP